MEFLKSAVASAISKGPPFPYTFGDRVDTDQSIWALFNGTKRDDGSECSIFSFDCNAGRSRVPLARNAVKKLKTLRHPGVIRVYESVETDSYIYIATERLIPLNWHLKRKILKPETIKWGLCSVAATVKFINDEAASIHGNLKCASVYTGKSGEWKLGGFEVLSSSQDPEAVITRYGGMLPDSYRYAPPEITASGWEGIKKGPTYAVDAYDYGLMIYEAYNGAVVESGLLSRALNVPVAMAQAYKRLIILNPKSRLSIAHFLEQGKKPGSYFDTPLIRMTDNVESLGLKNENEREQFLSSLENTPDDFPEEYFKMKVLPELLKSVEFGGGGPKAFNVVMNIGSKLTVDEWEQQITPVIVRLFSNPDRQIRVFLLDNLPRMIDFLSQKTVDGKIFPQMASGFSDIVPLVREQSVKAVLTIIPKLYDRTINGALLKLLAKTSNDEQPGIRTNTTVCLGKIAKNLGAGTRQKVLSAAFTRSLRDPFVHARSAALMALGATIEVFSIDDCAGRILPAVCPLLIDKEKVVRDQASRTIDVFVDKIKLHAKSMPETVIPPPAAPEATNTAKSASTTAEYSWGGWAVSSFTNKLSAANGDINIATTNGVSSHPSDPTRSSSAPPTRDRHGLPVSTLAPQAIAISTATASPLARHAVLTPSLPTPASSAADEADFDAWGDDPWNDATVQEDTFFDAVNTSHPALQPVRPSTNTGASTSAGAFDDRGEPDFAGWLAAQNQSKGAKVRGIPRGTSKPVGLDAGKAGSGGRTQSTVGGSGAGLAAKKGLASKGSATAIGTTLVPAKEKSWEEDGWGDGWS